MHFLIFIPDVHGNDPRHLEAVGLADFTARANFLETAEGPTGQPGVIVGWPKPGQHQMHYAPAEQEWTQAAAIGETPAGRYWVGFWSGREPTPADLQRDYQERGQRFGLGDGNEWTLPKLSALPRDMILMDDGTWKFEIQRQHHDLFNECAQWFLRFGAADGETPFSYVEVATFVLRCLRINYRITPEVVSRLRLLSTANVLIAALAITSTAEMEGVPHVG